MPNAKPEQDFLSPAVDFTASYLAGIFRFHKSMMRNLPWMQQRLPEMLRRNFFKKENSLFFTQLKAAATTYTGTGVGVIALVEAIGALEASDYGVNGVVINPSDWATISVTRDDENGFTLPSTVTFINGQLTVNGVPVYKASFVPANNFIVGDWTYAYKYVTDGLKVEFFEQDADNVETNAITSRVEESNVLVIEQPAAFIWGELDGATPSV
jgi:HK97 family phage major capsid protein